MALKSMPKHKKLYNFTKPNFTEKINTYPIHYPVIMSKTFKWFTKCCSAEHKKHKTSQIYIFDCFFLLVHRHFSFAQRKTDYIGLYILTLFPIK